MRIITNSLLCVFCALLIITCETQANTDDIIIDPPELYTIYSNRVMHGDYLHWEGAQATWTGETDGRSGTSSAIKLSSPAGATPYFHGFQIEYSEGIDLNAVEALSFWIRGSWAPITVNNIGFGGIGEQYEVVYTGENGTGISINTTWQNIILPIPKKKGQTLTTAFQFGITGQELNGREIFIDDIEFIKTAVSLNQIIIPSSAGPIEAAPAATPLKDVLTGSRAIYTANEQPRTYFMNRVKFDNWYNVTYTVSGNITLSAQSYDTGLLTPGPGFSGFTLTVQFDSLTSNTMTVWGPPPQYIWIENFLNFQTGPNGAWENDERTGVYYPEVPQRWCHTDTWATLDDTVDGALALPVLKVECLGFNGWYAGFGEYVNSYKNINVTGYTTIRVRVKSNLTSSYPLMKIATNSATITIPIHVTIADVWEEKTIAIPAEVTTITTFYVDMYPTTDPMENFTLPVPQVLYIDYIRAEF
ncbi:MAG: hypothetical protein FWD36_06045 [Treponema sp.]|nr:hypothetical protein [Treponema sp.]